MDAMTQSTQTIVSDSELTLRTKEAIAGNCDNFNQLPESVASNLNDILVLATCHHLSLVMLVGSLFSPDTTNQLRVAGVDVPKLVSAYLERAKPGQTLRVLIWRALRNEEDILVSPEYIGLLARYPSPAFEIRVSGVDERPNELGHFWVASEFAARGSRPSMPPHEKSEPKWILRIEQPPGWESGKGLYTALNSYSVKSGNDPAARELAPKMQGMFESLWPHAARVALDAPVAV